jgi:hypothetical protein
LESAWLTLAASGDWSNALDYFIAILVGGIDSNEWGKSKFGLVASVAGLIALAGGGLCAAPRKAGYKVKRISAPIDLCFPACPPF